MAFLNADIPHFYALLRREYLYDLRRGHGEFEPCAVFAVCSIPSRALMFHAMTEAGAAIWRLPISAFAWKDDAPVQPLDHLELWDCYDEETEVLARSGWRRFADVRAEDELATVNLSTDTLEYQRPTRLIRKRYQGPMVQLGGGPRQRVNVLVTPRHRMVVNTNGNAGIRLAQDLKYWDTLKTTVGSWFGDDRPTRHIPAAGAHPAVDVDAEAYAELLGWYVAEGCVSESRAPSQTSTQRRVYISQMSGPKRDRLRELVARLPWTWHDAGNSIATNNQQLFREVKDLGDVYTKTVPCWIKEASPRVIRAFLRGAVDGDGHRESGRDRYWTVSPRLADDMQELYLKVGSRATIRVRPGKSYTINGRTGHGVDQYAVVECHTRGAHLCASSKRSLIREVPYDGDVYCATVPNGTLVVRRGGKPIVCGNCFSYEVAVNEYDYLRGLRCRTILKDREWYDAAYMFTVDWCGSAYAEDPGEGGHKCAHILRLDNGNYAAQPNNRILFAEPSFIARPFRARPDYLTNSHVWRCEGLSKWAAEDSQRMFYATEATDDAGQAR